MPLILPTTVISFLYYPILVLDRRKILLALMQITVTSMFTNHTRNKQTSKRSSSVQPPQEPNQPRIHREKSSSTLHHNKSSRQATGAKGTEGHCRSEYQHQHQSQNKPRSRTVQESDTAGRVRAEKNGLGVPY